MKIKNNSDFFGKPIGKKCSIEKTNNQKVETSKTIIRRPQVSRVTKHFVEEIINVLNKCGLNEMANHVKYILQDVAKERFLISVVGEFSRGKSTFLNNLLDNAPHLPVGNLPTTAMITRIRYAIEPKMAVFDSNGNRVSMLDVKPESWDNLILNTLGGDQPKGSVIIGIPNIWLSKNRIELIDCPGVGDVFDGGAKQVADVLNKTEGAIIAVDARSPLSETEREFIYQRIIKRKTPFSMVVINKLDLINKDERNDVVTYIRKHLSHYKMDIPVYIPLDIEMTDDTYDNIKGIDKIKKQIEAWACNPQRQILIDAWVKNRAIEVANMAIDALEEQKKLLTLNTEKRNEIVGLQKDKLNSLVLGWGELEVELLKKSSECFKLFQRKVEEYTDNIIETLQYEVDNSSMPETWCDRNYPYRLKKELATLSINIENVVSRQVSHDIKWFNQMLYEQFKKSIQIDSLPIVDRNDYISETSSSKIKLPNINRTQNIIGLGIVALSVASYFTPLGVAGSMGFGAVGRMIQGKIRNRGIQEQREVIKKEINKDVPPIINRAIEKSEEQIIAIYNSIIEQSGKDKDIWKGSQLKLLEESGKAEVDGQQNMLAENLSLLKKVMNEI